MISVLYICLGNICRSPALECTLRHLASERKVNDQLFIDSCGLSSFHAGQNCDPRTFAAAQKKGIHIDHIAQPFHNAFLDAYDYVFVVTEELLEQVKELARPEQFKKILLATAFSSRYRNQDIPDPYYLGAEGFTEVMEIVLDSCQGFLDFLALTPRMD